MGVSVPSAGQYYYYTTENMNVSVPSMGQLETDTIFMIFVICRLLYDASSISSQSKLLAAHLELCYDELYPIHILSQ